MFRATSYVLTVRTLLYRRHPIDYQLATISRFPTNFKYKNPKERDTCPPPPPPPPTPPKDDRLLWGTLTLLFIAGGCVVYAKGSPEIRDWLTINAPWFDDIIAILYQENMTYAEFAVACFEDTKRYISNLKSDNKPKKCSLEGGPVPNYDVPEEPKDKELEGEESMACEPDTPPVVTQDICDIEQCMKDLGESALNNYDTAKEACRCYNLLVEETMQNFSFRRMKALRPALKERKELVKEHLKNALVCSTKLNDMVRYLDCGVQASKEQIENSKQLYRDYHDRFKTAYIEYQWEHEKSVVMDRQWQMVEELVDKYAYENEAMYPGLKYSAKKPTINGDVDVLLYNTYRYVHQQNGILKDYSAGMTERVNRAIDTLPHNESALKAREAELQLILKDKRAEVEKDFKKREDDQRASNERKLKHLLQKQLDRHEETMATRLEQKDNDLMSKFDSMVEEKVAYEKRVFATEIAEMALKLKMVEAQLNARLKAERETRRSQELWAAGASLLEATKKGDPYVKVDKELRAIEKASGEGDELITTVLKSIPESVRVKGIVPESALREGFRVMERTARNVALVEQDGAAMPVYILSWLQGLFLFMRISEIPQAEFEKPPTEPPENLDTFDLLQRARFWMDRGNLAVAVRYISSLQGASRAAAAKWFDAARAHLEVRQAAEAVLAHAAALGLRYI